MGDVVQVYVKNSKRGQWKIAIIDRLIPGRDGRVIGAAVRFSDKGKSQNLLLTLKYRIIVPPAH